MSPDDLAGLTVDSARRAVANAFRAGGLDSPDLDARLLVGAACGLDHPALIRRGPSRLGPEASATLAASMGRRLRREPVSRILGKREFWGLPLSIGAGTLDPRAETEGLVGAIVDALGGRRAEALSILDLGTGSGAVLCALLHEFAMAKGTGIDVSDAACRIAAVNLAALGLGSRGSIVRGAWFDAVGGRFDAIVSNPPYIRSGDIADLPRDVRDHDPHSALDGGADGLNAYRALVPGIPDHLTPGGIAAVECGHDQGPAVASMFRDAGLAGVTTCRDLAGLDRIVVGTSQGLSPSDGSAATKSLGDFLKSA